LKQLWHGINYVGQFLTACCLRSKQPPPHPPVTPPPEDCEPDPKLNFPLDERSPAARSDGTEAPASTSGNTGTPQQQGNSTGKSRNNNELSPQVTRSEKSADPSKASPDGSTSSLSTSPPVPKRRPSDLELGLRRSF